MEFPIGSDLERSRKAAARYATTEHLRSDARWDGVRRRLALLVLPPADRATVVAPVRSVRSGATAR